MDIEKFKGGEKIMRKHLITVTAVLLMLMFCQSVAAADNSTEDNSGDSVTVNNTDQIKDPVVLVIHSSTSSKMTNDAAKKVMGIINPSQTGYNPQNSSTWAVRFEVRTTTQISKMDPAELKALIESADIVIAEWLFDSGNFRNVMNAHPEIASNKPNKIFIVLESDPDLTNMSQINGVRIFQSVPSSVIGNTDTKNTILYDLKNSNEARLKNYVATYPQLAPWVTYGLYYAKKGTLNYENQFKLLLKNFTVMNGGTWPSEWEPAAPVTLPAEMLYRDGRVFTSLADYLAAYPLNTSRPTVGIAGLDSVLLSGDMAHFDSIIEKLTAKGMNVIPVVGAYSGVNGTQPLNIYSAMVKFFVYDSADPSRVITAAEYEANPSRYRYRIDGLVSFTTFTLGSGFVNQTAMLLEGMNVPVFRAMISTKREEGEWIISDDGLLWSDNYYQIAIPETQGIIEPIFVAAPAKSVDTITGVEIVAYTPIEEQMSYLVNRISNWVRLRYLTNSKKRVALIYYNYPPGKGNIGASYLNVPETLVEILRSLQSAGYSVSGFPQTADELVRLLTERGINVALWAPGELERLANGTSVILWDAEEYYAWFQTLNPVARKQVIEGPVGYIEEVLKIALNYVSSDTAFTATLSTLDKWSSEMVSLANTYPEKAQEASSLIRNMTEALRTVLNNAKMGQSTDTAWNLFYQFKNEFQALAIPGFNGWGAPPGNVMTVERNGRKYIVIPGLVFGNVFIGPEPQRGWEADVDKLYHSTVVAPPHQYLAWYAWVNTVFNADAQVHIGRHATYEWLPRKQVALSSFDFSQICAGTKPSVYIYIMDGVGEGIQSKRRGYAVIIDHLTPPMKTTHLYGDLLELRALIDDYAKTPDPSPLKQEYFNSIRNLTIKLNIAAELGINPENFTADDIERVEDYLVVLQQTLMPVGLHTFGLRWTDEEIALLAAAMVSSDGGPSSPSLQRRIATMRGWNFDNLTALQAEELNNITLNWILQVIRGTPPSNLTDNPQITELLNRALEYAALINQSFYSEINSLLDALNGGFITPLAGNDPVRNPSALPTGSNFYAVSENLMPTKTAWNLGKRLADMALAQFDRVPEKVAAVVWCVETVRDDGTMVSFVLRLMGVEPTWSSTGSASNIKATPLSQLLDDLNAVRSASGLPAFTERPRVDPVVTTSGLFRDLFPRLLINMDRAYRVALAASYSEIIAAHPSLKTSLDYVLQTLVDAKYTNFKGSEPLDTNYIALHWINDTIRYMQAGMNATDAGEVAITRIFAPPVGDYGAGVSKGTEMSWTWDDRSELAEIYFNRMSHAYSERSWGVSMPEAFKELLKGIQTAYHSRNTNLYGVADNDDYFDYFGGLSMAIEMMNSGRAPSLYVLRYSNPANPGVISLKQFLAIEYRTRYLNPEWLQSILSEGYQGPRTIAKYTSHLVSWEYTVPDLLDSKFWDAYYDALVADRYNLGLTAYYSSNPYAAMDILAHFAEMANRGHWNARDEQLTTIAENLGRYVAENGVSCSGSICGDRELMKWLGQYMSSDVRKRFTAALYAATGASVFAPEPSSDVDPGENPSTGPTTGQPSTGSSGGSGGGRTHSGVTSHGAVSEGAGTSATPENSAAGESGQKKSYEVTETPSTLNQRTEFPLYGVLGIVAILVLVGVGYFMGPGRR
ncbi:cobaltochelatase subunit CobN [Methanothermobacter thermautotrophicus]|nr:cobaltochelatase subunit CobN [Methanothermobacter thermautotrophicus]